LETIYGQLLRKHWMILVGIVIVTTIYSAINSLLMPVYYSEAAILIPPHDEYGGLSPRFRNIEMNERFLSTQVALLASDKILKEAWIRANSGVEPNARELESLRTGLSTIREPFNNFMTIRLALSDRGNIKNLLTAILSSYEDRFRKNALVVAAQRKSFLIEKIEEAESRIEAQEAELSSLAAKLDGFSTLEADTDMPEPEYSERIRCFSLKTQRAELLKELEIAITAREAASEEYRETTWLLRQQRSFIEVVTDPRITKQANGLAVNVVRGLLSGLFIDAILISVLALWAPVSRGQ
jgi:hypothetical protein